MPAPDPGVTRATAVHAESGSEGGERFDDLQVLMLLKDGDDLAFAGLVDAYGRSLLRVAYQFVGDRAVAEEVVQDTWIGFLESLDRFESRASIKTWLFRILVNQARRRRGREARSIPFSSIGDNFDEPSVDPDRFIPARREGTGYWASPPHSWDLSPEGRTLSREIYEQIAVALRRLPQAQREVVTMRDIEGLSAGEVCNVLGLTETNQRVLLHRARSKLRDALERYFDRGRDDG